MASREAFEVSALAWGSVSPTGQTSPDIAHKRYLRRVNPGRRGYWNGRTAPVSRPSCLRPRAGHRIKVDGRLSSLVWRSRIISTYRS